MGLTKSSTGNNLHNTFREKYDNNSYFTIALLGNPNVGKSTLFNQLTGMNQHTGNWPGKTVATAIGNCNYKGRDLKIVDLPGTYSLNANSPEEEIAIEYILSGKPDCVAVVCDATCLERNLSLVVNTREIFKKVIVCVNLIDEAELKGIHINFKKLSDKLNCPVVPMIARSKKGLKHFLNAALDIKESDYYNVTYSQKLENATSTLKKIVEENLNIKTVINTKWLAIKLLENNKAFIKNILESFNLDSSSFNRLNQSIEKLGKDFNLQEITDTVTACSILTAEYICEDIITCENKKRTNIESKIDKIVTGKITGVLIMIALLFFIFWLTISGANYPSKILNTALFSLQDLLKSFMNWLSAPWWLSGALIDGAYRVLAWVISVMLPPMAIFFPLFTILEDLGYLPRVAFNLDNHFKKSNTCGKQALTICMGFGCNAAGVVGCRIINSPRERLIATLTNNFVPCNGRYPTLIAIISMFLISNTVGFKATIASTLLLLVVIILGITVTFVVSKLLSKTILRGVATSFALELPPYRRPQIGKIIVRSIFDRTLFVLGRAAIASIPAGIIIWIMANVTSGGTTLLNITSEFLEPIGKLMGLDGVILLAFILGLPANEIVVPIILMSYMGRGTLVEYSGILELKHLLVNNGWTLVTAISMMLFCVFHWPCATTLLTIKKETKNFKWTALSFVLPTVIGFTLCCLFNFLAKIIGL